MNCGQIKLWDLLLVLTDIKRNVVRRPQIRLPRMRCAFRLRAHTRLRGTIRRDQLTEISVVQSLATHARTC